MARIPHKLPARRHGPRAWMPDPLARMRCEGCGARPVTAEWISNPAGGAAGSGYSPKKCVPLDLPWPEGLRAIN